MIWKVDKKIYSFDKNLVNLRSFAQSMLGFEAWFLYDHVFIGFLNKHGAMVH
jgi:hypothetical protein